ncbi:hypothetical protein [Deinococcus kurensis]|uniref:hypothetical protein n=1 Tax=Deinococcus kurensis TaxID=2662757 RepID=UPI0012D2FBD1|nr:hypothetical protein [Deinococcus kurensis]
MRPIPTHPNQTVTPADPDTRRAAGICLLAADVFNPALTADLSRHLPTRWCPWVLHTMTAHTHTGPDGAPLTTLSSPGAPLSVTLRHAHDAALAFHPEEWRADVYVSGVPVAHGLHSHSRGVSHFTSGPA